MSSAETTKTETVDDSITETKTDKAPTKKAASSKKVTKKKVAKKKVTTKKVAKKKTSAQKADKAEVQPPANPKATKPSRRAPAPSGRSRTFPFVKETVVFNHGAVAKAYDRFYDRYRFAFYGLITALQRMGIETCLDDVEDYTNAIIAESRKNIDEALKALLAKIEETTGTREFDVNFPDANRKTVEIPSHQVRQFLELLKATDRLSDAIVYAEQIGVLRWRERARMVQNSVKHVTKVGGRFHAMASKIRAIDAEKHDDAATVVAGILDEMKGMAPIRKGRELTLPPEPTSTSKANGTTPPAETTPSWGV